MPYQPQQYTITPWRTASDLLAVRDALYSPHDDNDHTRAITIIQAWKMRGNLPHAVESTGLLFEAARFHHCESSRSDPVSSSVYGFADSFPVRATYTMALSRFVTGFADLGRHRAGPGQTMQEVAKSINLPPHFVELRHEAAHEDMPTLGRLVKLTNEALRWLWETYWVLLDEQVDVNEERRVDTASRQRRDQEFRGVKDELRTLMKSFRSRRVAAVKKSKPAATSSAEEICQTTEKCSSLCGRSRRRWGALVQILVAENMIVPSETDRFT